VPAFSSIRRRAEVLASELDRMGIQKANIIAHSMGGLDARYAISCLGLGSRVVSLTTIGTPHWGTPLADTGLALDRWPLARQVFAGLATHTDGILDLSTTRMAAFNERVVDVPGVSYASYVTWVHGGLRNVPTLLAPGYAYLRGRAGDNDGMVPASSQKWGQVLGELHADHWAQIGWSPGVDVRLFYRGVARMLACRGF
jgi:triacylglycerol lipase